MEAEDMVKTQNTEGFVGAALNCRECELATALVIYNHELLVFNRFNYQSNPAYSHFIYVTIFVYRKSLQV
jgi:hypothetical protein